MSCSLTRDAERDQPRLGAVRSSHEGSRKVAFAAMKLRSAGFFAFSLPRPRAAALRLPSRRSTFFSPVRNSGAALLALLGGLWTPSANASPVLYAGAGSEKVHTTDVTVMQKDGKSVITVLPDYQGPLSPFALIIPVPSDVTAERVTTLKREFVDRVAHVSAPKFAEFWEMDPCDDAKLEQDWERDMTAKADTAFMGVMQTDPGKKVEKELLLDVEAKTKDGEYEETFVGNAEAVQNWLSDKGYALPEGGAAQFSLYESKGYRFLALDVDVNRVELIGGDRALLSPVRYWTDEKVEELPTAFGLPSAAKKQELTLFTLVVDQRMQVTNYDTKAVPTNLRVVTEYEKSDDQKFNLKEKTGELHAALHDRFLEKHPQTFLLEYAYSTADCGKPCPTEPLLPHEILSLGANVFEAELPEDVRRPEPPAPSPEEEAKLEALLSEKATPAEKKAAKEQWEADRAELAARKAMLERNEFVLTRLHYRYDQAGMPKDVKLGAGAPIEGGVALPQGEEGAADTSVKPAEENRFQTRYNGLFPNKIVVKCDNPQHHRWGKAPRSYRGLRKIWVAEDLSRRDRSRVDVERAVLTAVPDLGIAGMPQEKPEELALPPVEEASKDEGKCSCQAAGLPVSGHAGWLVLGLLSLAWFRRRRASEIRER